MKLGVRCSEGDGNFEEALREVEFAEEQGIDSAWVAEHHGWDAIWPTSHIALAALATRTERIELGTSITLLPQANPVRLAGEANLVDHISGGRFTLGVGTGWREDEMENLGYSFEDRGPRMTEHMEAMNALWADDVASYDGEFVSFDDFELSPGPVQEPHPPVWVGGAVDQALRRAAYLGDAWFPVWLENIEELKPRYETYRKYVREAGDDPADRTNPILRVGWVAQEPEAAREHLIEVFDRTIQRYRDRGSEIPSGMQDAVQGDFEEFAYGRFAYGDPDEFLDHLKLFEDELDVDHIVLKLYNPGVSHEAMMNVLSVLGEEVVPHLGDL